MSALDRLIDRAEGEESIGHGYQGIAVEARAELAERRAEREALRMTLIGARETLGWIEGVCVKIAFHADADVQGFAANLQGGVRSEVERIDAALRPGENEKGKE